MSKQDKIWLRLMKAGECLGCHQREDRSFHYKGYQFPLCARCTGVLAGEICGIVLILTGVRIPYALMLALIGIMGIDWWLQYVEILESNNPRRLITGTMCGAGATFAYFYVARRIIRAIKGK